MTYNNCLIWAITQKLKHGGDINWHKAKTWFGFHVSWTSNTGCTWEYTVVNQDRQPWWYIPILYKGIVKRRLKR